MIINNYNFEIYLEGYLVPGVIAFAISEVSDNISTAKISISGNNKALKLLAGTLVQIFGPNTNSINKDLVLLFEGELTSIAYAYNSDQGDTIAINARSILSQFYNTRLRPADAILTHNDENNVSLSNSLLIKSNQIKSSYPKTSNSSNSENNFTSISLDAKAGISSVLTNDNLNFAQVLKEGTSGADGNFFPFFKKINELFIQSDILYAINAKSLNLFDSLFVFPNPNLPRYFNVKVVLEAINNLTIGDIKFGQDYVMSLIMFFNSFKEHLYYRSISPASPTASNLFYSDISSFKSNSVSPIREYYIPGIESGPPMLCNIVFPEEIFNISFTHELASELTRLVTTGSLETIDKGGKLPFSPTVVSPDLPYFKTTENGKDKLYSGFTDEELYRGINLRKSTLNAILNKVLVDQLESKGQTGSKTLAKKDVEDSFLNDNDGVSSSLKISADRQFITKKFSTRSLSVSVNWNPGYVVGMPGMLSLNNGISIVGIISGVNHQASASGSLQTNLGFNNCRVFLDSDKKVSKISNPLASSLVIPETELPIYAGVKYMHHEALYSFTSIGEFLYSYITTGKFNKNLFNSIKLADDNLWSEFKSITDEFSESKADYSIISYIKDKDNNIKKEVVLKVEDYKVKHNLDEVPEEIINGIYLKEAILAFKKVQDIIAVGAVNDLSKVNNLYRSKIKNRNLITKKDYLKFIGAINNNSFVEDDVKDLVKIVNETLNGDLSYLKTILNRLVIPSDGGNTKVNYETIKNKLLEAEKKLKEINHKIDMSKETTSKSSDTLYVINLRKEKEKLDANIKEYNTSIEKYEKSITSSSNELESFVITSLLKPYNRTRKAHVIEAFKDFSKVYDLIIKEQ